MPDNTTTVASTLPTRCCVVGAGPAGAMLSLLLARRGVDVVLLEAHHDFDRDFRGDTVHPGTLELLDQLGLAERVHQFPHGKLRALRLHTSQGTITLAELAGIGICIDLFHCWAEADLAGLLQRALPRTQLIQLSDYVLGDRALPARAVPGDGAIPIEAFVAQALAGGYQFGFDLELLGPRIEAEGRLAAAGL